MDLKDRSYADLVNELVRKFGEDQNEFAQHRKDLDDYLSGTKGVNIDLSTANTHLYRMHVAVIKFRPTYEWIIRSAMGCEKFLKQYDVIFDEKNPIFNKIYDEIEKLIDHMEKTS